jgi:hypothetical protein
MNTHENDPKRIEKYLNELHKLHEQLQTLIQELASLEEMAIEDTMRMDSNLNSVVTTRHDNFVDLSTIRDIIALDECEDDGKVAARGGQGMNKRQKTQPDESGASKLVSTSIDEPSEETRELFFDGVAVTQPILEIEEQPQGQGEASSSSSVT